jgi:hypothetical protein
MRTKQVRALCWSVPSRTSSTCAHGGLKMFLRNRTLHTGKNI